MSLPPPPLKKSAPIALAPAHPTPPPSLAPAYTRTPAITKEVAKAEGAGMALGGVMVAGFAAPGWPWWLWLLGLAAPDLGMLGYLAGRRTGAALYNASHLYAAPFLLMQPGMGAGIAASRTPRPAIARVHSLLNHLAFGAGLYLSALLLQAFSSV